MTGHDLFYYLYASFTNAQLPLLKVAAVWFDKLVILDPVGAKGRGCSSKLTHPESREAIAVAHYPVGDVYLEEGRS